MQCCNRNRVYLSLGLLTLLLCLAQSMARAQSTAPVVTSFTPTTAAVGDVVAITGTNFTGPATVTFNGTAATIVTGNTATSLIAVVPDGATTGKITVTTPGGAATSAGAFVVTPSQIYFFADFENPSLDPRVSISTVGTFKEQPGIKTVTSLGGSHAFGFGLSTNRYNSFLSYVSHFIITFPQPTPVYSLSFRSMELYDNWGSEGKVFVDGQVLTPTVGTDGNLDFGRLPGNDRHADATYRTPVYTINRTVRQIDFRVEDITDLSEIFIKNVKVTGPAITPDLLVKRDGDPDASYLGGGVSSPTPTADESTGLTVLPGGTARYDVKVTNFSPTPSSFVLRAVESGDPPWRVTYRLGTQDITGLITTSGYTTDSLAPGGGIVLTVDMAADPGIGLASARTVVIQGFKDATDSTVQDSVQMLTTTGLTYQPDLSIALPNGSTSMGSNVFNNSSSGQSVSQSVSGGSTATYQVALLNAGSPPDRFKLTGPGTSGDAAVHYFDAAAGGNEITSAVTGGGWATNLLAAGSSISVRVEVTPALDGTSPLPEEVLIRAASTADPSKVDCVGAVTNPTRGHLWMKFEVPWPVRRDAVGWIDYGNDGAGNLAAPLLNLSSVEGNALMRLGTVEPYVPGPLQLLAIGPNKPVSELKPGDSMRIPFYFFPPVAGGVHFRLQTAADSTAAIDWAALEPNLRPPGIDPAAWAVVYANIKQQLGPTWKDFARALRADADYFAEQNHPIGDGRELCMLEVQKASGGLSPQETLAAGVDSYVTAATLQPFAGYWIYVNPQAAGSQPVTIRFTNGAAQG